MKKEKETTPQSPDRNHFLITNFVVVVNSYYFTDAVVS